MHNLIPHGWLMNTNIKDSKLHPIWDKMSEVVENQFTLPEDIISILVDRNFTPNAIGMLKNHCNISKKWSVCKIMNRELTSYKTRWLASFVTCQFSTLAMTFGYPQALACHKKIQYQ